MKKMGRKRLYSDEERKVRHNEAVKKWKENNPQMEKANSILQSYKNNDKLYDRGESDLTVQWIIENIFSKPCAHCGETDWHKLGCNRLDNSKPHTMDNVEPCCKECNRELEGGITKQVYQYTTDGNLVGIYKSTLEAAQKNGYSQGNISSCCNGKRYKTHKGYIWRYSPMN